MTDTEILESGIGDARYYQTINWSDLEPTIETGDIVLFSGQSMISLLIKILQGFSEWSHMGMFVRDKNGNVFILESTNADGQADILTGSRSGGVRLLLAETALRAYINSADNVVIVTRQLYIDKNAMLMNGHVKPKKNIKKLEQFIQATLGLPYEKDLMELARVESSILQLISAHRSKTSYFCSELIAQAYMILGLLPKKIISSNNGILTNMKMMMMNRHSALYSPADFSQEKQDLPFLYDTKTNGNLVGLGPHIRIVFSSDISKNHPIQYMKHHERPDLRINKKNII